MKPALILQNRILKLLVTEPIEAWEFCSFADYITHSPSGLTIWIKYLKIVKPVEAGEIQGWLTRRRVRHYINLIASSKVLMAIDPPDTKP